MRAIQGKIDAFGTVSCNMGIAPIKAQIRPQGRVRAIVNIEREVESASVLGRGLLGMMVLGRS